MSTTKLMVNGHRSTSRRRRRRQVVVGGGGTSASGREHVGEHCEGGGHQSRRPTRAMTATSTNIGNNNRKITTMATAMSNSSSNIIVRAIDNDNESAVTTSPTYHHYECIDDHPNPVMNGARRRSESASRVEIRNRIVARIGASLRIPSTHRSKADERRRTDMRRSYLKEGAVQLTALDSLLTHSRYLFLFSDLLLVAKQKAANSYKLKEKVRLDRIWIASNNCPHSFLIGWPICNFIAHFSTEEEKRKWQLVLSEGIDRGRAKLQPKFTTLPVLVRIDGRNQVIKKKIGIQQTSGELFVELVNILSIQQYDNLELLFDPNGGTTGIGGLGGSDTEIILQGPENIYCIVMEHVRRTGYRLSEVQFERLDTFPLVQCRLVLSTVTSRSNAAHSFVTQFKRVLSRSESKRFFGRNLEGSSPPQPVLTMIDHLLLHGVDVEGIFRKCPKQTTVRMLKAQLDRGSVPDFSQFSAHVTAALLKEYLRAIPGKLLLSGNYELWASAMEQRSEEQRRAVIRRLLQMLPSSHTVLLSSFLRLMRAISNSAQSKMNAQSLAVCIAPSLIDSPSTSLSEMESSAAVLPLLAEYLILNAPILIEPFHDVRLAISSSVSNDSGLSDVDGAPEPSMSPDSSALASPASGCSFHVSPLPVTSEQSSRRGYVRCKKHYSLRAPSSAYYVSSLSTDDDDDEEDDEDDLSTEIERDDDNDEDRTPVLSRENSNVQNRPTHIAAWRSASKERYIICDSERDSDKRRHELIGGITVASSTIRRRETVGGFCAAPSPQPGSAQPRTQVPADSIPLNSNNVSKNHRPLGIASSMRNGSPLTVRRQFLPTTETAVSDAESSRVGLTNLVMASRNELTRSSPAIVRRDQEAGSSGGILTSTTPTDLSNGSRLVQQRKTALPMTEGSPRILRKSSTLSTSSSLHSSNSCFASPLPPRRKNSGGLMSNDRRDDDAQIANTATGAKISTSASEMRKSFSFDNKETALRVAKSESSVEMPQISSAPTPYSSYRQEAAASNHRWALKKQFSEGACNMRTNVKATSAASDTDAIISRNHHRNLQETDTQRSRFTPPLTSSNVGKSADRFRSEEKFWASRTVAQTRCTNNNNNKTNKNSNHNTNSITLNEMNTTTTTTTGSAVIPSSSSRNNQSSQKNVVESALPRMSPPPMQQRFFTSPLVDRKRVMEVQPHPKVAAHSNEKSLAAQERRDSTPIGTRLVEVKPMVRESFAAKTPPPPLMYTSLITGGLTVADTNVAKLVSQKNAGLVEHVKPTSNQQQQQQQNFSSQTHRDTSNGSNGNFARRERKKNRSILMEPLEVNWSVDELRSIFQSESAPPALDTEYRASADSFSVR